MELGPRLRLKLYKGNIITCGRKSKYSLYDMNVASMEGVKQASLQNADGAQQLEAAARNLKELGDRLQRLIQQYRL